MARVNRQVEASYNPAPHWKSQMRALIRRGQTLRQAATAGTLSSGVQVMSSARLTLTTRSNDVASDCMRERLTPSNGQWGDAPGCPEPLGRQAHYRTGGDGLLDLVRRREDLTFKPIHGFASRGLLIGLQIGRTRLRRLLKQSEGHVAQQRVSKSRLVAPGTADIVLWADLRVWAYRGERFCCCDHGMSALFSPTSAPSCCGSPCRRRCR